MVWERNGRYALVPLEEPYVIPVLRVTFRYAADDSFDEVSFEVIARAQMMQAAVVPRTVLGYDVGELPSDAVFLSKGQFPKGQRSRCKQVRDMGDEDGTHTWKVRRADRRDLRPRLSP